MQSKPRQKTRVLKYKTIREAEEMIRYLISMLLILAFDFEDETA